MRLPFPPMLLERAEAPFADLGWIYQVKWDGVRNLTLVEGGRVRHWSRRLRERTALFPEFDGLARALAGRRAVLDGEIIVLRDGRPSFPAVLERDLAARSTAPARGLPATLMLFDLLELDGRELYGLPLTERLQLLERVVAPSEAWQVVASFPGDQGPALFEAAVARGLEGVVAKRRGSLYVPGTRSRDWLKVKRRSEMLAVVVGYTNPVGRPGGLLLGAYREGRLRYIGRVGSGLTAGDLAAIRAHLPPGPCPFDRLPALRDRFSGDVGPVTWVEPRLTVRVAFTEWTEEQRLRDPVVVGFSTEPPEAAVMP
ncbi:bifunctional non-homologous end joining protein LigD [Symbiobacterium terraclitae]|uniref:DNA ligase (ATP) n=1 Tax=Symbiobacterium terraclitae TaxID=557451 RepID=A0ABS4JMH8_9FIRM|nr:non-homologous end-joining DNA ligase [Symbiobacterium terraclitae]MBP2016743.1 bifunctional non-homologous end joining protein LigD [Symbiobacterium terraclitae]